MSEQRGTAQEDAVVVVVVVVVGQAFVEAGEVAVCLACSWGVALGAVAAAAAAVDVA